MGKYSKHNEYRYNNEEVPSVTTILKILAKPALVKWANVLGFKRKWVDSVLEESSEIGTRVHFLIEAYFKQRKVIWIDSKYATKPIMMEYLNHFFTWRKKHNIEMLMMEESLSCDICGGTVDFYGIVDGKKTIIDFKTSKRVYSSMFLQLSAYAYMLEKQGMEVEQVAILAINRNKYIYKTMDRDSLEKYMTAFISLAETFKLWYNVNIDDKWGDILE